MKPAVELSASRKPVSRARLPSAQSWLRVAEVARQATEKWRQRKRSEEAAELSTPPRGAHAGISLPDEAAEQADQRRVLLGHHS